MLSSIPTGRVDFSFMKNMMNLSEKNNPEFSEKMISSIFEDIIGSNMKIKNPITDEDNFLIYADYTSSGRGLNSIENFINNNVLPVYANIHSTVGFCAEQTANLYKESKDILRDYTNSWGNYSIVYHGQGCTGAIYKCIDLLNIKHYVTFYQYLESLSKIYNSIFKYTNYQGDNKEKMLLQFQIMTRDLRRKIDIYFRLFFFQCNFCHKTKTKEKSLYRCLICNDDKGENLKFDSEGSYHSHENTPMHIKNRKEFFQNGKKNLFNSKNDKRDYFNFLDEIRNNYKIKEEKVNWKNIDKNTKEEEEKVKYIYDLIKDYKKFKPTVFVTIYEHNSNKLSWIETGVEVVTVKNLEELHSKLTSDEYKDRYIKIGSFTAASNITGLLIDTDAFSIEMHKNKGFAFFDYASGAPYLQIDLNGMLPLEYRQKLGFQNNFSKNDIEKYCYKDGIFFSPHKFVGGPNTPGVLIMHNRISMNTLKPTQAGGGTVNFVLKNDINYILDVEIKEESGTPNIIGNIRVGLMTLFRSKIDHNLIIDIDESYNKLMEDINEPNIYILENDLLKGKCHIPVFSFMISYGGKFYHPNYICALLNDLFGIQSRPGCSCAPDYGQLLLKKNKFEDFNMFKNFVVEGNEIFKPGYTRLNLPYFYPKYVIEYIIKAIQFICQQAHLFIGLYNYDIKTGKFFYFNQEKSPKITKISNIFEDIQDEKKENKGNECLSVIINENPMNPQDIFINKEKLDKTFKDVENYCISEKLSVDLKLAENIIKPKIRVNEEFGDYDKYRWFLMYKDVQDEIDKIINININNKFSVIDNQMEDRKKRIPNFNWSLINKSN